MHSESTNNLSLRTFATIVRFIDFASPFGISYLQLITAGFVAGQIVGLVPQVNELFGSFIESL